MSNPALTEVLASYVPKIIQKRIAAETSPIESPVAEEIQAAVLFADISGFTRLTERLAEAGPSGVEKIANVLNDYFGQLIEIVHSYGGDVVKFAGDAVIAIWHINPDDKTPLDQPQTMPASVSRADQWQWTMRAAECALEIHERLSNYKVDNEALYLKLAISAGSITTAHVGGVFNRWEFLITGNPLIEVGIANNLAKADDIIITPAAWRLIRNDCNAEVIEFELRDAIAQGGILKSLNKPSSIFGTPENPPIPEGAEKLLRPYIPGAIINRLTAGQSSWIAELRRVTVLFINLPDVDQHTKLAVSQDLARMIQRSIYRYEGSINKISVDDKGIMIVAAMGLPPFSHEDDPARGVQAALIIRKELERLKVRSAIGITTGRIFCGSIGNDSRREYTTIGNAVNLSSRLMTAAKAQDEIVEKYYVPILCDKVTFEAAKASVEFEPLAPQQVKGRTEPVEVFHPIDLKKSVIRPSTELIGRQEEKSLIANALQEFTRGTTHQTLIMQGEAGIGKSRLFEDLVRQAESLHVKMFVGGGDPIDRSGPYHVWRPIFFKIFEIDELASKITSLEEVRNAIQEKVSLKLQEVDPDLVRYLPLLDVILPIQIADNELTSAMTGEIRSSNIREVLVSVLAHEASLAPLLVVLEDLHWFDSASWALLVDVQEKVRPIFLAVNTRPLSDPVPAQYKQILDYPNTHLLKLEAMMLDDVEALVCQRLGVRSIPPMIGRLIREKSEGHPFFAEELAYALRQSGVLVIEDQECRVYSNSLNYEDLILPDTLQAAITNRIDSLDPSQQLTLKVASVIGRIFTFRVLHAIHPIESDKPSLPNYMETLTRLSLTLVESEAPDLAYIFKHAVTQEVAYNLMLYSQRRQLHQAVAEWIEQNHTENLESYFTLLAHHWMQATEVPDVGRNEHAVEKALEFLEKAGEQAMQNYANAEAIQFFTQAVELDERIPRSTSRELLRRRQIRRAHWHSMIGLAYYGLGLLPECDRQVREALKLLDSPIPSSSTHFALGLIPQMIRQGLHRFFPSRYIGSIKGPERDAAVEVARLYELMSRVYFYSNEALPVVYVTLRFLNEAEKAGVSPELAVSYATGAVLAGFVQLHKLAEMYVVRGLAVAEEVNQPSNRITVNVVTGVYQITVGRWEEIRVRAMEAKLLCEKLGDYRQWGDSTVLLAESAFIAGDIHYALNIQNTLLEDSRRRHNPLQQMWALFGVAAINIRLGREADSIPLLEEALQLLDTLPNFASSINTNGQLALAYHRIGDTEKALAYAGKVLELAANIRPTVYSLDIGFATVAEVYFELWENALKTPGQPMDAERFKQLSERSLKLLLAFKNVFPIGQAYLGLYRGWYEWLMGKHHAAIKTWQKGLDASHKYDLKYEEGMLHLKLGEALVDDAVKRTYHLERAIEIFETMGSVRELILAKKKLFEKS